MKKHIDYLPELDRSFLRQKSIEERRHGYDEEYAIHIVNNVYVYVYWDPDIKEWVLHLLIRAQDKNNDTTLAVRFKEHVTSLLCTVCRLLVDYDRCLENIAAALP